MLIETLKKECAKKNIDTAVGLYKCMKRELDVDYSYGTINLLWKGKGKIKTYSDALKSLGISSIKLK